MFAEDHRGGGRDTVLSDGTRLDDLVDVERRQVSMRVLWDPEVYQLELHRIFAKVWVALAHESEIPNPGDFVTRHLGEDQVIVVRDQSGEIHILLNVCQHRGMEVCRAEVGNATNFRCPYHYWVYDLTGRFLGSPVAREQMHGDILPKSKLGLRRARVARYAGMIFGTFDGSAPPLDDYLGDIKWYLDLMFDRTDEGFVSVGPPQRFTIPANWKCAGEQFAGDGYHTLGLHRSMLELGALGGGSAAIDDAPAMYGIDVSAHGHGLRCIPARDAWASLYGQSTEGLTPMEMLRRIPPPGMTRAQVETLEKRFDPDQLRVLAESPPQVGGLFPNNGVLNFYSPMPGGKVAVSMGWHTFVPKGPQCLEFLCWVFVERGALANEELNRRATIFGTGSSGLIEQDDAEAWPSMQRASRGVVGRTQTLKYQALLGEKRPEGWPGPGKVYAGFTKDDNQWNWWLRWRELMTGSR